MLLRVGEGNLSNKSFTYPGNLIFTFFVLSKSVTNFEGLWNLGSKPTLFDAKWWEEQDSSHRACSWTKTVLCIVKISSLRFLVIIRVLIVSLGKLNLNSANWIILRILSPIVYKGWFNKDMFVLAIKHNFEFRKISVLSILCNVQAQYDPTFCFLEPWFHKD